MVNKQTLWRQNNPDKVKAQPSQQPGYMREWAYADRRKRPEYYLLKRARQRAKEDGVECTIASEDVVIPTICPIMLTPLVITNKRIKGPRGNSPSLDRIDNTKGYIPGNISVISQKANARKGNMSVEEVERLLQYMKGLI